jgi:DNA-binding CsgD family transcriptional regulator
MPYEVVAELIRELGRECPTVLVLEDVHWADEATLDVLRLLGRRVEAAPGLILASYRDDELDRARPLRIVVGELGRAATTSRLSIEPLSREAVAMLAEPYRVDSVELYVRTGGNPFYVTEVLAGGGEEIPVTVRDAVFARADRLSPGARRVLEAVAVVPPQAELWLLDALAGADAGHVDECLGSGMLTASADAVAFRHELARLAVEDSVSPRRRLELHRKALAAIAGASGAARDLARLAHHAEAAGDAEAVLEFAPDAAARAASLGAHRESAAQYLRALRLGDELSAPERAGLLERYADECFTTDQYDEGIAALEQELALRRAMGDGLKEGDALARLSNFLWCPGRTGEAERSARESVALLERFPAGRELAAAYDNLAAVCKDAMRFEEGAALARQGLELSERLGETEVALHALAVLGACERDYDKLEQSLDRATRAELDAPVGYARMLLLAASLASRRYDIATRHVDPGIAHCSERGLELYRLYLLAYRARLELDQGLWSAAADTATSVLRIPRTSTTPRIVSLVVLALVRARRGDPEVWPLLNEAWALAEPTQELPRLGPVAAARAEAAWLESRPDAIASETESALELAQALGAQWLTGELACWRQRAGIQDRVAVEEAQPYALELTGESEAAATAWAKLGCQYESALALAQSNDPGALRRAHENLNAIGARPAAAITARRLRDHGVHGIPRGPRPATRENPAGLTTRELEVLALIAEGLRNSEIADRLVLSPKTVDHHVSAILRKLNVPSRREAAAEATQLGLLA